MVAERLAPTSILVQIALSGSVTDIQDDPDSPDGNALVYDGTTNNNTDLRAAVAAPSGPLLTGAGLQEVRALVRKNASGGNATAYSLAIWYNGAEIAVLATGTVTSLTGEIISGTFDASILPDLTGDELEPRVQQTSGGANGSGGNRRRIETLALEMNVEYNDTPPEQTVTLPLLSASTILHSPEVAPGDVSVAPPLLDASATFHALAVSQPAVRPGAVMVGGSYGYGLEGSPRLTTVQPYTNQRAVNSTDGRSGNPGTPALVDLIPHVDLEDPGTAFINQSSHLGNGTDWVFHERAEGNSNIFQHVSGSGNFTNQMGQVDDAVTLVGPASLEYRAVLGLSLGWRDEVADATPWSTFETQLLGLIADYRTQFAARTGQTFQPRLYTQQGGWWNDVGDTTPRVPPLDYAFNLLALAQSNQNVVLVDCTNWARVGGDNVHLVNSAYRRLGELLANAYHVRENLNEQWLPLHATAADAVGGNVVRLSYHIPAVVHGFQTGGQPELVLDTDDTPAWRGSAANSTDHGFRYIPNAGPSRSIVSVAVNGDQVDITLDGPPEVGATIGHGDLSGAPPAHSRVNLRDNWNGTSENSLPLWNFAVVQQVTITGTPSLQLPVLDASAALSAPSASPGAVSTSPPLLDASATLSAPAVQSSAVGVELPLLAAGAVLHAPSLATGAVDLTLPTIDASASLHEMTVARGAVDLTLPALVASAVLHAQTLTSGGVALDLPLLNASATLAAPEVDPGAVGVSLPLLDASASLSAPNVNTGQLDATLPLLDASATLLAPHLDPARPIGYNLDFVYDVAGWNFANKFRQANPFHSGTSSVWDDGRALTIDAEGYPTSLLTGPDQQAITLFATHNRGEQYELTWDGNGTIQLSDIASIDDTSPNYILFTADVSLPRGQLRITSVGSPHITNIQIRRVGETEPVWDSTFLATLAGTRCLRFMQWAMTNSTGEIPDEELWANRVPASRFSQQPRVAWELMIDLCNRLGADAWVCLPHRADDDYCEQLGTLWGANLDPNLRVRLEWSNEVWNGTFGQHQYAIDQGVALGLDQPENDTFYGAMRYQGLRSMQTFQEFEFGFNGGAAGRSARVIRTVSGQTGFTFQFDRIFEGVALEGAPSTSMDAVSVNLYIGNYFHQEIPYLENSSIAEILQRMTEDFWDRPPEVALADEIVVSKTIADNHNCELVAYEGGQHLAVYDENMDNVPLVNKLSDANRDLEMYSVYQMILNQWTAVGGGLFCHYTFAGSYGRFGAWGALEYNDQALNDAHKYRAIEDWGALSGVIVGPPRLLAPATLFSPEVQSTSGTQNLDVPLLVAAPSLFAPEATRGAVDTDLPLLAAPASLFAPTVSTDAVAVSPPTLVAGATLFSPEAAPGAVDAALPLLAAGATLQSPTLSSGGVALALPALSASATLFAPDATPGPVDAELPPLAAMATLTSPTVAVGAVDVSAPTLSAGAALFAPAALPAGSVVVFDVLDAAATLHTPTAAPGPVSLEAPLLQAAATAYGPTLAASQFLDVPALAAAAQLHSPSLAAGALNLDLPTLAVEATLFSPTAQVGSVSVELPLLQAAATLHAPGSDVTQLEMTLLAAVPVAHAPTVVRRKSKRPKNPKSAIIVHQRPRAGAKVIKTGE